MQDIKSSVGLKIAGGALISALSFASIITLHPLAFLLASLSPLALYYVCFTCHPHGGALAGTGVTLFLSLFLGIGPGLMYGFLFAAPLILMAFFKDFLLVTKDNQTFISLEKTILGNIVYFSFLALIIMGLGLDVFTASASDLQVLIYKQFPDFKNMLKPDDLNIMLKIIPYIPGIMAVWGSLVSFFNGALALNIVKKQGYSAPPFTPLSTLELPFIWWIALAGTGAVSLLLSSTVMGVAAKNLTLVLFIPFLIQGLGVVSVLIDGHKNESFLLLVMAGIAFVFNFLLLGVAIIGIFEPWLMLRQKIKDRRRNQ